tara:strand:- start:2103 stop:2294 length:192 start_codon:yes stop_codon:yes gene_type:complete
MLDAKFYFVTYTLFFGQTHVSSLTLVFSLCPTSAILGGSWAALSLNHRIRKNLRAKWAMPEEK